MFTKKLAHATFAAVLAAIVGFGSSVAAQARDEAVFVPSRHKMSVAWGGWQWLNLHAGVDVPLKYYLIVGTASGTAPGIPYREFTIPINWDFYTEFTLRYPNAGLIWNQLGRLDAAGNADAGFWLPMKLPVEFVGLKFHHCYLVFDEMGNVVKVSNAVGLTLVE